MGVFKFIYKVLKSLRTANILLFLLIIAVFAGAIVMPLFPSYRKINSTNLFTWLSDVSLTEAGWLYIAIAITGLIVLNTAVCTVETLIKKDRHKRWLLIISPQLIHLGFSFIMLAHLLSSYMAVHGFIMLYEGAGVRLNNGDAFYLKKIDYTLQRGYITEMKAELEYMDKRGHVKKLISAPNKPALISGTGIYLKDIEIMPVKKALFQISNDPGALWGLFGGIIFMIATTLLVILKVRQESVSMVK